MTALATPGCKNPGNGVTTDPYAYPCAASVALHCTFAAGGATGPPGARGTAGGPTAGGPATPAAAVKKKPAPIVNKEETAIPTSGAIFSP